MDTSTQGIQLYVSRLSLPAEQFDSLAHCPATPEALQHYLEQLPHSNAAELCNRLYKLLPQVAGLNLPPGRKILLLDLVKPEAMECVRRLTNNLAITPSSAKLLSLATAMLRHLASGYKSVIAAVLQSPAAPPNLLVEACHAAISVLRQILMECWQCYVPPPANTWLELHAVYGIARLRGIERAAVRRRVIGQPQDNTIHSTYIIPLMIACADPARYTPQDLRQIEYYLQSSAHLVDFDNRPDSGIFVIDPNTDCGPQYSFRVVDVDSGQFRLRTFRLVRTIEEELAVGTLSGLNERLARELCRYWSSEIQRREEPEADNTEVSLILGLSHVHRHLTNSRSISDFVASIRHDSSAGLSVLELQNDTRPEYRDTFIDKKPSVSALSQRQAAPQSGDRPRDTAPQLRRYPATRVNVSDHGARIEFNAPGENLTAGEVVLIQQEGHRQWQLGLVRWTQVTRQLTRLLGVEILASGAVPCAVAQTVAASPGDDQYFSGLYFHWQGEERLMLPTLPFKPYTSVRLLTTKSRKVIKLRESVESTFHISMFRLDGNAPG